MFIVLLLIIAFPGIVDGFITEDVLLDDAAGMLRAM